MRDHDDGDPVLVQLLKNSHDLDTRPAVEIAGRLIRKQDFGLINQRARNRDALLLTAGKLARMMIVAAGESDRCKHAIARSREAAQCVKRCAL